MFSSLVLKFTFFPDSFFIFITVPSYFTLYSKVRTLLTQLFFSNPEVIAFCFVAVDTYFVDEAPGTEYETCQTYCAGFYDSKSGSDDPSKGIFQI